MSVNSINKQQALRALICLLAGIGEALLLARLLALLLAARPDNPAVSWLLATSAPLRLPLALLDAGQPRFGARLEFSTLAMAVIVLVGSYLLWRAVGLRGARRVS